MGKTALGLLRIYQGDTEAAEQAEMLRGRLSAKRIGDAARYWCLLDEGRLLEGLASNAVPAAGNRSSRWRSRCVVPTEVAGGGDAPGPPPSAMLLKTIESPSWLLFALSRLGYVEAWASMPSS